MKKINLTALLFSGVLSISASAETTTPESHTDVSIENASVDQSDDHDTPTFEETTPGFYIGVNAGKISVDQLDNDTSAIGITFGYEFANNIAIEFQTLSGDTDFTEDFVSGSVDLSTSAAYVAWRSEGDLFFKAKAGLLSIKSDISSTATFTAGTTTTTISDSSSETESALSYAIGAGYRITDDFIAEAEYTVIDSDVSALTLGLAYKF